MNLRNRLLVMALLLVAAVMAVSTSVAYLIIQRQSRQAAGQLMARAFQLIGEELETAQNQLTAGAGQLAAADKMPVNVKYIVEYGARAKEPEMRSTYAEILQSTASLVRAQGVYKAAIYDAEGRLMVYAQGTPEGLLLGYTHPYPTPERRQGLVKSGQEINPESWQASAQPPEGFAAKDQGQDGQAKGWVLEGGTLCLAARAPIVGQVYDRASDSFKDKRLGTVVLLDRLDLALAQRLGRLTATKVNVFTSKGLSVGTVPGYTQPPEGWDAPPATDQEAAEGQPAVSTVKVEDAGYYQAALPLGQPGHYLGALACLYSQEAATQNSRQMTKLLVLAALACVAFTLPAALIFAHRLAKPVNRAIAELNDMAGQMAAAASQVSAASQALAANASTQAGSLEQISAALAETTSMAQQNSAGAQQADQHSRQSIASLQSANVSMKSLIKSMHETAEAGEGVVKVVQSIDGIAFQINLLALNAAVEAARAGEAGAGFAVVAEEVRSLAQRSAEASQNTHALVEDILVKIRVGSKMVEETDQLYAQVARGVQAVNSLVAEIAAASNGQLRDIEQVGQAVQVISAGTQQGAASSQQSASASEQMSAQSRNMKTQVDLLRALIQGRGSRGPSQGPAAQTSVTRVELLS